MSRCRFRSDHHVVVSIVQIQEGNRSRPPGFASFGLQEKHLRFTHPAADPAASSLVDELVEGEHAQPDQAVERGHRHRPSLEPSNQGPEATNSVGPG